MKKIACEAMYCVYWQNGCCSLDGISIDNAGRCEASIFVDVSHDILNAMKEQMLKNWESDETQE